ncbi:MAG: ComEC/Rec2 family competence protein [Candidatus Wildermuthbacteria bacterium]|nr:ComEC/Rec2 family competence protein [Candidatus Wildermuthbacteria bacterium]
MTKSNIFFILNLCVIGGVFAYTLFLRQDVSFKEFEQYEGKRVLVQGMVAKEPQKRSSGLQLVVRPEGGFSYKVLATADAFIDVEYGDSVELRGVVKKPPEFDDFNYREYLEAKGIGALMQDTDVEVLGVSQSKNAIYAWILAIKQRFRDVIFRHTSPPESAVLLALLLGDQGAMPNDMKDALNKTGLRHFIAISGQHIVILTNMLVPLFLAFGLWKKQAIVGAFLCMVLFVLLTGAEASAVRSGIMGGILLLSQYLGRMQDSLRILAFAAALMLLANPLLLTRDAGFQLSFLATLGIIVLYPWFRALFSKLPETLGMRDILAMNAAAQVFTFPVLAYNFGYISLIGFVTNLLVLPLAPLLLGLGFAFLVAGSLWSFLGFVLSFPVIMGAKYLLLVVNLFASFPFSAIAIEHIPVLLFLLMYIPFIAVCWKLSKAYESQGPWYTV